MLRSAWKQWRSWPHASDAKWPDSDASHSLAGWIVSPSRSSTAVTGSWASQSTWRSGSSRRSSATMARSRRTWPRPIGEET